MSEKMKCIAVDVGNSETKISDGRRVLLSSTLTKRALKEFFKSRQDHALIYSSVNDSGLQRILELIPPRTIYNAATLLSAEGSPLRSILSTGTGTDRIVGCIGAMRYAAPPLVTIDFGTATTVNVVNKRREFVGGYIMPGVRTQITSLHTETAHLPLVVKLPRTQHLPTTTEEAIAMGVAMGTTGSVLYVYNHIKHQLGVQKLSLVCTGGNVKLVQSYLQPLLSFRTVEHLTLQGIFDLAAATLAKKKT